MTQLLDEIWPETVHGGLGADLAEAWEGSSPSWGAYHLLQTGLHNSL